MKTFKYLMNVQLQQMLAWFQYLERERFAIVLILLFVINGIFTKWNCLLSATFRLLCIKKLYSEDVWTNFKINMKFSSSKATCQKRKEDYIEVNQYLASHNLPSVTGK